MLSAQGRIRSVIVAAVITFATINVVLADDPNPDAQYRDALTLHQKAAIQRQQADELEARIAKIEGAEAKERLKQESAALRQSAEEAQAEVLKIMESLAPRDKKGYGPAHLWLVDQLYRFEQGPDGKTKPPTPKTVLECERRLLYALEWQDEIVRVGAHHWLARIYRDAGRIDEAKKHLTEVASRHPEFRLILAQWAKAEGEHDVVVRHAQAAEKAYRAKVARDEENPDARLGLADCLILQEKFAEGEKELGVGAALATSKDVLRTYSRKRASLCLAWFDAKEKDPKSTIDDRLELLEKAMQLDSENPEVYNRFLKLCRDKTPDSERAREKLRRLIADGRESFMLHLFLGIDAWEQKNHAEARHHWEKALKMSKNAPIVANNLAWLLAFSEPVDLPRALELANTALETAPDAGQFRGTRGHILLKLGRHKEALADLEKAISAYPKDPQLFRALSEASRKLGFSIQADQYQKRAEELEEAAKAKPSSPQP